VPLLNFRTKSPLHRLYTFTHPRELGWIADSSVKAGQLSWGQPHELSSPIAESYLGPAKYSIVGPCCRMKEINTAKSISAATHPFLCGSH